METQTGSLIGSTGKDQTIIQYVELAKKQMLRLQMRPSILCLRKYILEDPLLRMQVQAAIDQIPKFVPSNDNPTGRRAGMLSGSSLEEFFGVLNAAVQTVPPFVASDYVGTPIGVLLLDMMNTESGRAVFARSDVNSLLKPVLDDYAALLRSQQSLIFFNQEQGGLFSKQIMNLVNYDEYVCDRSDPYFGFRSWNEWFTRDFVEGARPVEGEADPCIIVHNTQNYPLSPPVTGLQASERFWIKGGQYSLYDMLDAERQGIKVMVDQCFVGGSLYQGYLDPWCYHQWHAPVSGTVEHSYRVPGAYFLQSPGLPLERANNYDESQPFLASSATRHVFIIDTHNPKLGRVAIIQIGMVEISSCIPTVKQGDTVKKGQLIGRFELGGSSQVVIFERKAKLEFNPRLQQRETKNGFVRSTLQKINSWLANVLP